MIKNLKNKKKGFTLIELIIVIAIIAILAAVAIPKFGDIRRNANLKADVANAKTIANTVSTLISEGKIVPTTAQQDTLIGSSTNANTDTLGIAIESAIQNVPTPQSKGKTSGTGYTDYKVTIDADGTVKVYVGSDVAKNMVFPTPVETIE